MPLLQRHVSVHAILSSALGRSSELGSGFLSWGSSKIAPPPMKTMRVHSQAARRLPFGTKAPTSARVPPLPFHPAPTVYPAQGLAGLLHPATGHGVRHISSSPLPRLPKKPLLPLAFPNGAYTLRSFSLRDSRSASPRPLPSRRCLRFPLPFRPCKHEFPGRFPRPLDLRALLHRKVRCFPWCCHQVLLDAPLGFRPSNADGGAQAPFPRRVPVPWRSPSARRLDSCAAGMALCPGFAAARRLRFRRPAGRPCAPKSTRAFGSPLSPSPLRPKALRNPVRGAAPRPVPAWRPKAPRCSVCGPVRRSSEEKRPSRTHLHLGAPIILPRSTLTAGHVPPGKPGAP
jgi:hypothetical protein